MPIGDKNPSSEPLPAMSTLTAAVVAPPRDNYTLFVNGAMNPAIHHAQWYRMIGAIDEQELQLALKSPNSGTTPIGSMVELVSPNIVVRCQPGQWSISATEEALWSRMMEILSLVFFKLQETPVSAIGLASQRHLDTEAADIKSVLGARIASLGLGLPSGRRSTQSTILLNVLEGDYELSTTIQPSVLNVRAVFGAYNRTYPTPKGFEYFDVGPLLSERLSSFMSASKSFFANLVADIDADPAAERAPQR